MNATNTTTDFLAGLTDEQFDRVSAMDADEMKAAAIRAAAHIVNGGTETFPCPACKGRGVFLSYVGRVVGQCFKCKGTKVVSKGVIAAAKGKVTKAENAAAYRREMLAEISYLENRANNGFRIAADLLEKLTTYGSFTDGQVSLIRKFMIEDAERRDGHIAKANAEREAKSGEVDVSAINALFARAVSNDIKRPIFRTEHLTIKASRKDAAVLFVTDLADVYLGKIVAGKFMARTEASATTLEQLRLIAADPQAEAVKYGRLTSNCGCCGRGLVDPVSIRTGIGPICAEKFGFTFAREVNRDVLATEAQEQAERSDALPADLRAKGVARPSPVARKAVATTIEGSAGQGAVAKCRIALAACNGDRVAYIALCDTAGVARATANTQWTRLRK